MQQDFSGFQTEALQYKPKQLLKPESNFDQSQLRPQKLCSELYC